MNGLKELANDFHAFSQQLNSDERVAKALAHYTFDKLWKKSLMTRSEAYNWLAKQMRLNTVDTHIEFFDKKQCEKVIRCVRRNFPDFFV